jgi:hypothetical protein
MGGSIATALVAAATAKMTRWAVALRRSADAGRLSAPLVGRAATLLGLPRRTRRPLLLRRTVLLLGSRLLISVRAFAAWLSFAGRTRRSFRARSNRSERNTPPIFIDIDDPDFQHVAHADDFVRVANEAIG